MKVLAMWWFAWQYDWVFVVDSDAVVLDDSVVHKVVSTLGSNQDIGVWSDLPYVEYGPCTGLVLVRGGERAAALLEQWWHTDSGTDVAHAFEQKAFQHLTFPGQNFSQYSASFAARVVQVELPQFHVAVRGSASHAVAGWHSMVLHVSHVEGGHRERMFDRILDFVGISSSQALGALVPPAMLLDVLSVSTAMLASEQGEPWVAQGVHSSCVK